MTPRQHAMTRTARFVDWLGRVTGMPLTREQAYAVALDKTAERVTRPRICPDRIPATPKEGNTRP